MAIWHTPSHHRRAGDDSPPGLPANGAVARERSTKVSVFELQTGGFGLWLCRCLGLVLQLFVQLFAVEIIATVDGRAPLN
jgi:hypothetical protein